MEKPRELTKVDRRLIRGLFHRNDLSDPSDEDGDEPKLLKT